MKSRLGPDGVHLFDRRSGLNVLLDEIPVSQDKWSRAPRYVSVALTNACDLSCAYCYAPKAAASLEVDQVCGWLKELDTHGCLGVGFGGGEPTLYSDLAELCRRVVASTQMAVTMTTHGHRLTRRLLAELSDCVHFVRISVDGVAGTYERLRCRPFSGIERCTERLRGTIPFGINCVVNDATLPELDEVASFAAMAGASQLLLLPEQPTAARSGAGAEVRNRLTAWVESYSGPVPLAINESDSGGLIVADPHPAENGLRAYAHISASGTVKRSSYDPNGVQVAESGVIGALQQLALEEQ